MFQFPAGNSQQKQTYKIWTLSVQKKLVTKSLCFPAIAICCNVHQVYVGEYGPGEALHVDVDLTTVHTLMTVWVHPSKQMTLHVCHKYKKQFTCTLVEHVPVIPGASPNLWQSAAPQECYVHQKLNLQITSWPWRGSLRQQQPSGSKPGIFECICQDLLL
jgi:hypothetical protein